MVEGPTAHVGLDGSAPWIPALSALSCAAQVLVGLLGTWRINEKQHPMLSSYNEKGKKSKNGSRVKSPKFHIYLLFLLALLFQQPVKSFPRSCEIEGKTTDFKNTWPYTQAFLSLVL